MTVSTTGSATSTAGIATPYASVQMGSGTATDKTDLGNDDFLQLLVKQLQYQDPTAPMDSNAVMQQTATLSSTQSMQAMTKSISDMTSLVQQQFGLQMRLGASSLVGQQVSYTDATGTAKTGTVTAASFSTSTPALTVGSDTVALDAVTGIATAASAAKATSSTSSSSTTASSSGSTTDTKA